MLTPAFTIVRVAGTGDLWLAEARLRYRDGSEWCFIKVLEPQSGKVHRETDDWAPASEAPAWRTGVTEPLGRAPLD